MKAGRVFLSLCSLVCGIGVAPTLALDLRLPSNAQQTTSRNSVLDSYAAPIGVFENGAVPFQLIEGEVRRSAYKISSVGLTTLQVLQPLREQLQAEGYSTVLDCDQSICGGFDFRFGIEVLPAPDMYVNIRAYRFMLGVKGDLEDPEEVAGVLVSTSPTAAYVQLIHAGRLNDQGEAIQITAPQTQSKTQPAAAGVQSDLSQTLLQDGSVVLDALEFATGTSNLGVGPFPALAQLAEFLAEREDVRVALVGHTDSIGRLDSNIALSRQRARSVRQFLISRHGVDPARLDAEGMGYLAPIASNLEAAGRKENRRVEAIVLPN